jgi:hypothetical protein
LIGLIIVAVYNMKQKKKLSNPSNSSDPFVDLEQEFLGVEKMAFHNYDPNAPMIKYEIEYPVVYDLMNETSDAACTDFYEYACGSFSEKYTRQTEVFERINHQNKIHSEAINAMIAKEEYLFCVDDPTAGCTNALKFFQKCKTDRQEERININWEDVGKVYMDPLLFNKSDPSTALLRSSILKKMKKIDDVFDKMRFLVENGITNYVHLTREQVKVGNDFVWVHYLRPGGVSLPEGLSRRKIEIVVKKEIFGVGEFLSRLGDEPRWASVLNAQNDDEIIVENMEYFENMETPTEERLVDFVQQYFQFYESLSCLQMTKVLFPMTFCRLHTLFAARDDDFVSEDLIDMSYHLFFYIKDGSYHSYHDVYPEGYNMDEYFFRRNSLEGRIPTKDTESLFYDRRTAFENYDDSLRVGSCSALLHSNNMGKHVFEVETQKFITKHLSNNSYMSWAHEYLIKRYSRYYEPMYLYFSYPRVMDLGDTPLEWYSTGNPFYDDFHGEIVISPGTNKYPLYDEHFSKMENYARYGQVLAHEVSHFVEDEYNLQCLVDQGHDPSKVRENFADVLGYTKMFEYFYAEEFQQEEDICDMFLVSAQLFCAESPDRDGINHGSKRERVNHSIDFASSEVLEKFNECFTCSKKNNQCINF